MGLDTHRVSNKVSKITSRHLVPLDRAFPAHALVHGSRALGEPRSTSWPSWRQQVHDLDMKSSVHPKYTTQYHVGNWPPYDRALVQRGDITVWLAPDAIATWEAVGVGKRGGQLQYSDLAIETALTLRLIFHLPLRQTEGFLTSIFGMLGLDPVTLWLTPDAIATWAAAGVGRRSGQLQYSDLAIETALTLSLLFH